MIISRTPFRISLFGGGSDIPIYYKHHIGKVIGFTFDRYNYILFNQKFQKNEFKYNINYSLNEKKNQINKIEHRSVRETLKYFKFNEPFELHYNGELPARTGLGTSSAFTVGLCNIMNFIKKIKISKFNLAKEATYIEQKKIKEFVGSQDQIHTSVGGLNKISFDKKEILVQSINLDSDKIREIEMSSLLVFTGISRIAEKIEEKKFEKIDTKKQKIISNLVNITDEAEKSFRGVKLDIRNIGSLLDDTWKLKRSLDKNVSNIKINEIYEVSKNAGAYGGKILGAGGGGFLYLLCSKKNKKKIKKQLRKLNLIEIKLSFNGSEIISATSDY